MAIARRGFVRIAVQSMAVLVLPALKLAAPVVTCAQAIRSGGYPIPIKPLRAEEVKKPGRWGG